VKFGSSSDNSTVWIDLVETLNRSVFI